jgi:hypothetical protein
VSGRRTPDRWADVRRALTAWGRFRFGLHRRPLGGKLFNWFLKEELMASRRPTDSTRPSTAAPVSPVTTPIIPAKAESASAEKSKSSAKPRAPRAKKAATSNASSGSRAIEISEDVRRGMIAEAAYLRAERRGFSGGHEKEREDWVAAEAEVDALLKAGHGSSAQ